MNSSSTKQKSRVHSVTRAISAVVVILAVLAVGRFVLMASGQTSATAAGPADVVGGRETDLGEALMEMEGGSSQDPGVALAPGWFTCDVHRTGPGWGNVYLRLSSSSFSQRWFKARDDQKKEILATGLTAISSGKKVSVYVTGTAPFPYGEIKACYVLN